MKRKILTMITIGSIICMMLTGCGGSSEKKAGLYQSDGKFIAWNKLGIDDKEVETDHDTAIYITKEMRPDKFCGKLVFPDTITKIGATTFYGEFNTLTSIDLSNTKVTSIGDNAFLMCILESADFPDTLTSIGEHAFYACKFTSVDLSNTQLTSIGKDAFEKCISLESIDLPDALTSIGDSAFRECTSLTSIDLPDALTSIGDSAFRECTSLTSIDLPDTLTSIGYGAFDGCTSLESIDLSNTQITSMSVRECYSLTSIDLPDTLTGIDAKECPSLTNINYAGTVNEWKAVAQYNLWYNNPSLKTITCSDGIFTP